MTRNWAQACGPLVVLAMAAAACADDDDGIATTVTTSAVTTSAVATSSGAGSTTGGSGTATATSGTAVTTTLGLDNPKTGEARDSADFLNRLARLSTAAQQYADPVEQVSGATAQGVTDTTITIGSVTAMTSPQGLEPFAGMCEGMMARIGLANAGGGVTAQDGRTRRFEFAGAKDDKGRVCQDDALDRDRNRQKIKDLVEGDQVFAVLPVTSSGFFAGDYLNEQHIPYFGWGFQPDYCGPDKPFAFGVGGGLPCDLLGDHIFVSTVIAQPLFEAAGLEARTQRVALAGSADPASTAGLRRVKLGFEASGATVVTTDNSLPPVGTPLPTDFTPFVTALLEKDPTVVSLVLNFDQVEPMARGLRDAGYDGVIQQFAFEDERLAAVADGFRGIDGSYVGSAALGAPVGDTEGLTAIRSALDAAGFARVPIGTNVEYGWGAADMLIAMIERAPAPLTTENVVNAANAGWGYPGFGEAVCPSYWPLQHYIGSPCLHVVQLDLTGAHGATNSIGANAGKGGLIPKVTVRFGDLFVVDRPE